MASLNYTLPGQITADTAEALTEALAQLPLRDSPQLTLDGSGVDAVSSCGMQILVALDKTIAAAEGELKIIDRQNLFQNTFQELGLGWLLKTLQ